MNPPILKRALPSWITGGLLLTMVLVMPGCDLVFGDPRPDFATLSITGRAGEQVRLVFSDQFLGRQEPRFGPGGLTVGDTVLVSLFSSDTLTVTLPFEQRYDIHDSQRFYAEVLRFQPETDSLHMRAWIDDQLKYDVRPPATVRRLQFLFAFSNLNEIEDPPA